jgi:hypothetical protein
MMYLKYLTKVKYLVLNKKLNIVKMSVIIIIVTHTICWSNLLEFVGGEEVKNTRNFVHLRIEIMERQIYLPFLYLKLL